MIEQLKVYDTAVMALEIVDGFTEADYELVQEWANAKREQGFTKVNLLLKTGQVDNIRQQPESIFRSNLRS